MSASKKTKKPKKRSNQKKADKKAIHEAVDKIPGLILEEKKREAKPEQPRFISNPEGDSKKKFWLWTGVIGFSVIIFIIWIMSVSNVFDRLDFNNMPEKKLFEQSKEEMNAILESIKKTDEKRKEEEQTNLKEAEEKLNQTLLPIIEKINNQSTTSTATTTEIISSTTTINQ